MGRPGEGAGEAGEGAAREAMENNYLDEMQVAKGSCASENSSTEEVRTYPLGSLTSRPWVLSVEGGEGTRLVPAHSCLRCALLTQSCNSIWVDMRHPHWFLIP